MTISTTTLPRANGEVERLNSTENFIISEMSQGEQNKLFQRVSKIQEVIMSTYQRSTKKAIVRIIFRCKKETKITITSY